MLEGIGWKFWSFNEFVGNLGGGEGGLKGMLVRWFVDLWGGAVDKGASGQSD